MLHNLFTYNAWSFEHESNLKDYCYKIRDNGGCSVRHSNIGGYQSPALDLDEPKLQPLINSILNETSQYSKHFETKIEYLYISQMWISINSYKDLNIEHRHANCVFSGVYYISTPPNCGSIEFVRPDSDFLNSYWWNVERKNFNAMNTNLWWLSCQENMGYIFPSYYAHRVQPNLNKDQDRISISFNIQHGEKPKSYT